MLYIACVLLVKPQQTLHLPWTLSDLVVFSGWSLFDTNMGYMTTPSGFRKFHGLVLCLALSSLNSAFHFGYSYWVRLLLGLSPLKQENYKKYRNSNMKQASLIFQLAVASVFAAASCIHC